MLKLKSPNRIVPLRGSEQKMCNLLAGAARCQLWTVNFQQQQQQHPSWAVRSAKKEKGESEIGKSKNKKKKLSFSGVAQRLCPGSTSRSVRLTPRSGAATGSQTFLGARRLQKDERLTVCVCVRAQVVVRASVRVRVSTRLSVAIECVCCWARERVWLPACSPGCDLWLMPIQMQAESKSESGSKREREAGITSFVLAPALSLSLSVAYQNSQQQQQQCQLLILALRVCVCACVRVGRARGNLMKKFLFIDVRRQFHWNLN